MKIWVYLENREGEITEVSLQCLEKGRELARAMGGALEGVALGRELERVCRRAGQGGAAAVHRVESPGLLPFTSPLYVKVLARLIEEHRPAAVLFPASTQGSDLAPALAGALRCGSVMECSDISFEDGGLVCRRLEYDRKALARYVPMGDGPGLITLVDGVAEVPEPGAAGPLRVEDVAAPEALDEALVHVIKARIAARTVNLRHARIIVAGGAGAGSLEGFRLVEELARALAGEVGATRAAVDAGWASHDRQIGQTGVAVRPDLYIACGISGAAQHRVGILGEGKVVAINTDPSAAIFRIAHWAILGDLRVVIPRMIRLLGSRAGL